MEFIGFIFIIAIVAFYIYAGWRIFEKAGRPGWESLIPIYSAYVLMKIIGKPGWWVFLLLIPIVNFVILIISYIELAKVFGKGTGFGIGLIFLSFIFIPILAFGDATYQKPEAQGEGDFGDIIEDIGSK